MIMNERQVWVAPVELQNVFSSGDTLGWKCQVKPSTSSSNVHSACTQKLRDRIKPDLAPPTRRSWMAYLNGTARFSVSAREFCPWQCGERRLAAGAAWHLGLACMGC